MTDQPIAGSPAGELQFDTAEHAEQSRPALTCAACNRAIQTVYHQAAGKVVCSACRSRLEAGEKGSRTTALIYGAGAAIVAAALSAMVLVFTNLILVSIIVGFGVGHAVFVGSGRKGGRSFQWMAVVLTYLGMTASFVPLILNENSGASVTVSIVTAMLLPFLAITSDPFLVVILAIGVYRAWRMTAGQSITFTGPHQVAAPAAVETASA
jgi:hypothetical protein